MLEIKNIDTLQNNFLVFNVLKDLNECSKDKIEPTLLNGSAFIQKELEIQAKKFKVHKENIVMNQDQINKKYCREEKTLLDNISTLTEAVENWKQKKIELESKLHDAQSSIQHHKTQATLLHQQRVHLKSEQNVIENLEKTKKGFELALLTYQLAVGIELTVDAANSSRYLVTFTDLQRRGLNCRGQHKVAITRHNQGFSIGDGAVLSGVQLMQHLIAERKRWLATYY